MKDEAPQLKNLSLHQESKAQVTMTGVGKKRVLTTVTNLLESSPLPDLVLSLGFSGALSDQLNTGDLILPRKIVLAETGALVETSNEYYTLAEKAINEKALPYVRRDSVTVPNLVRTRAEKEELAQRYNCQAVNMEEYWVGFAAYQARVPFISVRAILDMTHQELPSFLEELIFSEESRRGIRIIFGSLARPSRLPKLIALAKQSKTAQKSLDAFTSSFVAKVVIS